MNNREFSTEVTTLKSLEPYRLIIPSYQRPYVWSQIEIRKLLGDFYNTFKNEIDKNTNHKNYYVGTILFEKNENELEVIDGQQRFTTFWLIAFVLSLKNSGSELENLLEYKSEENDRKLKLSFEIRTEVQDYLYALLKNKVDANFEIDTTKHPYLKNIATGLTEITSFFDEIINPIDKKVEPLNLEKFGNYIYNHVCFIKNTTPKNLDLNKLFSTVNSTGIQLEQTDIVKSILLRQVDQKVLYSKIWEACENMTDFFERNVRKSFKRYGVDWKQIDFTDTVFLNFTDSVFDIKEDASNHSKNPTDSFSLDEINYAELKEYALEGKQNQTENRENEQLYCRSIINFGQLLLHTYRIHLKLENKSDFEEVFHINRLIKVFENLKEPSEIKRFIKRLWSVRYLFDKYIVKWIYEPDSKEEVLALLNVNKSEEYYTRTPFEKSGMLMLQSVLYFTGDYLRQYWLTPFLYYLFKNMIDAQANEEFLLNHLEGIDNALSLSKMTVKEATFELMEGQIDTDFDFENYLHNESLGTGFKHYWFQKLEYVLWKNWENKDDEKFKNFQIRSRNSIEHIYPQHNSKIAYKSLHSFGNLVLLSVSQNSEYGKKPVNVKRSIFEAKEKNYDTLKSFNIFTKYEDWNEENIKKHKDDMVSALIKHYNPNYNDQ